MNSKIKEFMLHQEKKLYHPNTYVFYGNTVDSDGSLSWSKVSVSGMFNSSGIDRLPYNHYRIIQDNTLLEYKLKTSESPGDGTVPVESLASIRYAATSILATSVDHQSAYDTGAIFSANLLTPAIKFTLRAIIKIVHKGVAREAAQ